MLPVMPDRPLVLFLCTHNSARSQMAEGLLRHDAGERFRALSAGTERTRVHPLAVRAMAEIGIDITGQHSKTLQDLDSESKGLVADWVVTVCNNAREACPIFPARVRLIHEGFADPSAATGSEDERLAAFVKARDAIRAWLQSDPFSSEH